MVGNLLDFVLEIEYWVVGRARGDIGCCLLPNLGVEGVGVGMVGLD